GDDRKFTLQKQALRIAALIPWHNVHVHMRYVLAGLDAIVLETLAAHAPKAASTARASRRASRYMLAISASETSKIVSRWTFGITSAAPRSYWRWLTSAAVIGCL